ncbi:hypothetical protein [Hyalangium gracile]|uniref:hypothetical protein n=1 Tax=Hyalangium gracile TaxID=394092 RepID=UPI001CCF9EC1|nr:hypothetical protein [Hyalangium gracile]
MAHDRPIRLLRVAALVVLGITMGCGTNPNVRVYRRPDGLLEVAGPLAGPFRNTEELAANACKIMTSQGGATGGVHGSEYCALSYYAPGEDAFYLSYLSDVREKLDTKGSKTCSMPQALNDPSHSDAIIIGGDHTHPHNIRFSPGDLSGTWRPSRVVDKKTGRVFHRELYLLYLDGGGVCRAFGYNYVTRIVSALRERQWVQIGRVYDESGNIQMFEGKDWLP